MTKMTKSEKFALIIAILNGTETITEDNAKMLTEFCAHERELLANKKASTSSKPTKTQLENENIKAEIVTVLTEAGKPLTVGEIVTELNRSDVSIHKASALITQLKNAGTVTRVVDKKKAYFSIATATADEQ